MEGNPKCQDLLQDILKITESLLVVAGGRPLLQALSFGGVDKLSRRISHFLQHGSIHRTAVCLTARSFFGDN